MLVICEDCAKKYHIDEKRLTAEKARFACRACGHIIVVEKPNGLQAASPPSSAENGQRSPIEEALPAVKETSRKTAAAAAAVGSAAAKIWTKPAAFYLLLTMLAGLLTISCAFILCYFSYVGEAVGQQIELRNLALAASLRETVRMPLQQRNYLLVNQETKLTATLPGVAYAAVINEKGLAVAGFFNTLNGFDSRFAQQVNEKGFPVDILAKNGLKPGVDQSSARISIGGLYVHDLVVAGPDRRGEVHVGIHAAETDKQVKDVLLSPLFFLPAGLALLFCVLTLFLVNWLLVRPLRSLTSIANRISLGEVDLAIVMEGSRELRDLGMALSRMRHSIKIAVDRLQGSDATN